MDHSELFRRMGVHPHKSEHHHERPVKADHRHRLKKGGMAKHEHEYEEEHGHEHHRKREHGRKHEHKHRREHEHKRDHKEHHREHHKHKARHMDMGGSAESLPQFMHSASGPNVRRRMLKMSKPMAVDPSMLKKPVPMSPNNIKTSTPFRKGGRCREK